MSVKTEKVKLNRAAIQLVDVGCHASVKFAEGSDEQPTLEMQVYSGGIIKDHWWWGDLAIDLSGMSFPKKKFPILEDHMTNKKIGFATKMSVEGNKLTVVDSKFIDTPESLNFREASKQGFPYEASMYAQPTQIQRLMDKETAEVNGFTMKGPGTIWRKCVFKEASVCTFGYDSNTNSRAMSENEEFVVEEITNEKTSQVEEVSKPMTREEFKAQCPEEYAKLCTEVTVDTVKKFTEEKAGLETKIATLEDTNTKLSAEIKENEKKILVFEQAEEKRAQEAFAKEADDLFKDKFADSELPERLFAKVRRLVDHEKFIKDRAFDKESFGAAVDAELKDWTTDESGSPILGVGSSTKSFSSKESMDTKSVVERMSKHVK